MPVVYTDAACNTTSVASGCLIWPLWHTATTCSNIVTNICTANTATTATTTIWPTWHQATIQLTDQEQYRLRYLDLIEAERQRELQYQESVQRVRAELAEKSKIRQEAERRAKAILIEHLTPEQQETIEKNYWFVVVGGKSGKSYRIKTGSYQGNIEELEKDSPKARFCCHANHALPMSDQHLTQKMMIESDEDEFLRVANCTLF